MLGCLSYELQPGSCWKGTLRDIYVTRGADLLKLPLASGEIWSPEAVSGAPSGFIFWAVDARARH